MKHKSVLLSLLGILLLLIPRELRAADNWIEVRSPHFTVFSNAGEKETRRTADQFEQIRQMFHSAFGGLRVDPAQPVIIVAVKSESTMKAFLPEQWEVKGHVHAAGLYQPGLDKDYVVMRLDSQGENPFHTLYHEYTHALLRLNFSYVPLWFDEGLAEFFGNSTLGEKESKTGTPDPGHIYLLQQSKLIPIETLLQVDHQSPYYNESNRASVFYAESWALVHYLMLDQEARQKELLKNFLSAWQKSGSQVEAAQAAFGNLKQFGKQIEAYCRQSSFRIGVVKASQEVNDKNYSVRSGTPGEALALRGDFFAHHNRVDEALPVLQEAVKTEPNLPFAHEALAYAHFRKGQLEEADKDIEEAINLGAKGFAPQYFHGIFLMRKGSLAKESIEEAKLSLEKAVQLNPQYAPAYEGLSQAYSRQPSSQKEAVSAAIKAVQLDPGQLTYAFNLTYMLINSGRFSEARTLAQRILAAARTPEEKLMANALEGNVKRVESLGADGTGPIVLVEEEQDSTPPAVEPGPTAPSQPLGPMRPSLLGIEGKISAVECTHKPAVALNVSLANGIVILHATDLAKVALSLADGAHESLMKCEQWEGRRAKVWFVPTPGKEYAGEIAKITFF